MENQDTQRRINEEADFWYKRQCFLTFNMDTEATTKYLNQIEAARHLGFSKSTISLMTSRGDLPHYRVGRAVRYTVEDLDNFMESRRVAGTCEELGRKAR